MCLGPRLKLVNDCKSLVVGPQLNKIMNGWTSLYLVMKAEDLWLKMTVTVNDSD